MTDLFREVEEDIRREQFQTLWKKYGAYVVGAALLIVLVTAAIVGWRAWSHSKSANASAAYEEVVKAAAKATPVEAAEAFARFAEEQGGAYAILARLQEADRRLEAGEREAALRIYDEVAANSGALQDIRDMAVIKSSLLHVDNAGYEDMKARLTPLIDGKTAWRENALEILALAAIRAEAWADASNNAQAIISNPASPAGLRDRAHVIQALAAPHLPREAVEDVANADDAAPAEEVGSTKNDIAPDAGDAADTAADTAAETE